LMQSLRNILFGNTFHIFNYEWKKSFFKFREPFSDMSYALETERVVSIRKLPINSHRLLSKLLNEESNVVHFAFQNDELCFRKVGHRGETIMYSMWKIMMRADFDCTTTHLLHVSLGNFVCRQALLNLLLTGRATPHVFNGASLNDEQDEALAQPLHGVLTRSHVGYLLWNREQVGSMLKTPKLPIWVCNINGTYSVLFSPNRSLLSDWKMEHLFHLYFYNGQPTQLNTTMLTIDTHSHHWEAENNDIQGDPEKKFPSVEMTIRTKWEGSVIDWNGTVPFF
uniref:Ubiquitin carboxyl-terminal hydrolase MINDY n=1 Tax=Cyprinus carpio TaxID=7962 RepID=A0A8C1YP53_CYPCA